MAQYEHLPIYKGAFDLLIYSEKIVKNFSRYNKYTHGSDLCNMTRPIVMLIVREANNSVDKLPVLDDEEQ
jgi:hypothetical protein